MIFWLIYMLDKGLCLRLGRAASIQDYDITVPMPTIRPGEPNYPGNYLSRFWIKLTDIQGRVYEELYSPRALKSGHVRTQKAERMASEIKTIWTDHDTVILPPI